MQETKEITIDEQTYIIKLLPTMDGLDFISRLNKEGMSARVVFDAISRCVQIGSASFSEKKFNSHFRGRYGHLMKLVDAVVEFNFPDLNEGNAESDTDDL
jgi:hypothetical protein